METIQGVSLQRKAVKGAVTGEGNDIKRCVFKMGKKGACWSAGWNDQEERKSGTEGDSF